MKKVLALVSTLALSLGAFSNEETRRGATLLSVSPILAVECAINGDTDTFCLTGTGSAAAVSITSTLLLKEIESAQPDAMAYVAGAAPSPLLYSVVEKLQTISSERLGETQSFDGIVNQIINTL